MEKTIPAPLYDLFTMNGKAQVHTWLFDDSHRDVSGYYTPDNIEFYRQLINQRHNNYYGQTDTWLYQALQQFPITGTMKRTLIFGSETPWYEMIAQNFGAASVTVVEYNARKDFNGIHYTTPAVLQNAQFEVAFSISSFEHDGLGRYGDPINPQGDMLAMQQAARNLVDGGILYLAVPVGIDAVVWNAHRVYGEHRLPMLLQGWKQLASFGFSPDDFKKCDKHCHHQPVFVLQKGQ